MITSSPCGRRFFRSTPRTAFHAVRGQALVETALVLPMVLFLIFAFINVSQMLWTAASVQNAASLTAAYAAVSGDPNSSAVAEYALTQVENFALFSNDPPAITISCASNPCRRYDPIEVRIEIESRFIAPMWFNHRFEVEGFSRMRAERDQQ